MSPSALARKRLTGHWQDAVAVQTVGLLCGLVLLLVGGYADRGLSGLTALPTELLRLLMVCLLCLIDLLVRSPILAGQAVFYRALIRGEPVALRLVFVGFRVPLYKKAVALRAAIWTRRMLLYIPVFLPSAVLLAIGDRLRQHALAASVNQISYFILSVIALYLLAVGWGVAEIYLLRFMPAWQLLPDCDGAKDAMRRAARCMKGQTGSAVWLYSGFSGWLFATFFLFPYHYAAPVFRTVRAAWVENRQTVPEKAADQKA